MSKGLYLILILSLLPVLVATAIGLLIGLLQTVIQIQEQILPFSLKLVAVFICLLMQPGWLAEKVIAYATEMFNLSLTTLGSDRNNRTLSATTKFIVQLFINFCPFGATIFYVAFFE
ncbi:hypothetical protein ARAF_1980 [Arsenophonus endosymbiont of Aleurodicus floccissimus]|nr:hypothetical protein ARAF_1980 [Arsenophonus endosymbiont of Aleurodicus floccissimus]